MRAKPDSLRSFQDAIQRAESIFAQKVTLPSINRTMLSRSKQLASFLSNESLTEKLRQNLFYTPLLLSAKYSTQPDKQELKETRFHNSIFGKANGMEFLTKNVRKLLDTQHPMLDSISKYYFSLQGSGGKKLRPLLVLLISRSLRDVCAQSDNAERNVFTLAMITELIHTASLLHDDVIDEAEMRRGMKSAHMKYGNKMAILAGDFLLSRASVSLARLRNTRVVELLAEVIGDLVEGEVLQMQSYQHDDENDNNVDTSTAEALLNFPLNLSDSDDAWFYNQFKSYTVKTYMKTASLIAKSCRASVILSDVIDKDSLNVYEQAAFEYGRNLGISFQLMDDCLDFTSSSDEFGKPSNGFDLELGLATAPVLFAYQSHSSLKPLIERRFKGISENGERDSQVALELVRNSDAIEKTKDLARWYSGQAIKALEIFPSNTESKAALLGLAEKVVTRNK